MNTSAKKYISPTKLLSEGKIPRISNLFRGLTSSEQLAIFGVVSPSVVTYLKNETIVYQGDEVSHIGVLLNGSASSEKYHIDGRRQVMRRYSEGELLCTEAVSSRFGTSPVTIIACSESSICWLSYEKMIQNQLILPEIRFKLLENIMNQMADENIKLSYKVDVLSNRKLRERILTYLSIISEKRQSVTIRLFMNQVEFADYLCVDRSALSNELNLMRKEGIISYKDDYYTIHKTL